MNQDIYIPHEIYKEISKNLTHRDVLNLNITNHFFNNIFRDEVLKKNMFYYNKLRTIYDEYDILYRCYNYCINLHNPSGLQIIEILKQFKASKNLINKIYRLNSTIDTNKINKLIYQHKSIILMLMYNYHFNDLIVKKMQSAKNFTLSFNNIGGINRVILSYSSNDFVKLYGIEDYELYEVEIGEENYKNQDLLKIHYIKN